MLTDEKFVEAFVSLGNQWQVGHDVKIVLEEFVCQLYSSQLKDVNEARCKLFISKHAHKNNLIDLSLLASNKSSLILHMK